jgi:hypothetical protein
MSLSARTTKIAARSFGMALVPLACYNIWTSYEHTEDIEDIYVRVIDQKDYYENTKLIKNIKLEN